MSNTRLNQDPDTPEGMSDRSSTHSSMTQVSPQTLLDDGRGSRHGPYFDSPPDTPNTLVQDQGPEAKDGYEEKDAAQYERFSPARKIVIVSILSYCAFLAPISSTAILAAVPELAKTYETTSDIINASNALYLAFMGIASTFWGPVSQVWGRRPVCSPTKHSISSIIDISAPCRYLSPAGLCSLPLPSPQPYPQTFQYTVSSES